MEKIEYHDVNKFLHLKDNTSAQIKAELDALWRFCPREKMGSCI